MKIHQIVSEDRDLDEAPMGMLSRVGQKIKSKIPGEIGSRAQGALAAGDDANAMKKDLARWMGQAGIKKGQLSVTDFKSFLTQKGLPDNQVDSVFSQMRQNPDGTSRTGGMTNKEVDDILHKAVQQGAKSQDPGGVKSRFAQRPSLAGQNSGGSGLPRSVTNAVNKLSPAQKAALKGML
jgi:hypothetical protein